MPRMLSGLIAAAIIISLAVAGWYFRPWSPYSPNRVIALDNPAAFPQTFQRMDDILPSRTIEANNAQPWPEAIRSLNLDYDWQGQTRSLERYLLESNTIGLVVLKDGVIVGEQYLQGAGAETRFTSWSVAKSFIATLIAMAIEDGRIDSLDDPVAKYVPDYAGSAYGETSLRHVLMMSAGVEFNEDYSDSNDSDIRPFFFDTFVLGSNPDEMARQIERRRRSGLDLHYTSPNTHVLSAVLRALNDAPLAEIVEDQIWTPLGMTRPATWLQNINADRGIALGYCCLQATTRDFARLGQLYLQDGVWNGERLLPEGWVQLATRPNAPFQEAGPDGPYAPRGYGLHFWVPPDHDGEFFAAGVFGQYVWVDEQRGVVIAVNAGDPTWDAREPESFEVFRAIAEYVSPDPGLDDETGDESGEESVVDSGEGSPEGVDPAVADPSPEDGPDGEPDDEADTP